MTVVSPGAVSTELVDHVTDPDTKKTMENFYASVSMPSERVAQAISLAVDLPEDSDINEIVMRPSNQQG